MIFCQMFRSMQKFLELQCLVDVLVDFYQCFINLNILFDEVDRVLAHESKQTKNCVRYLLHHFFLKTVMG